MAAAIRLIARLPIGDSQKRRIPRILTGVPDRRSRKVELDALLAEEGATEPNALEALYPGDWRTQRRDAGGASADRAGDRVVTSCCDGVQRQLHSGIARKPTWTRPTNRIRSFRRTESMKQFHRHQGKNAAYIKNGVL